ncbi:DUF1772 domain-containing protein [Martelella radicis]|uniref:Putative membrane protein n=1 Tax=Martelella radicis TaxID=1397476 RepID=A0A7W6KLH0_9HYPH|nr:anthrone oxygenase family protein [Martelella radicis]MBB4123494.1 putative membrane protein [Martelella radicis]
MTLLLLTAGLAMALLAGVLLSFSDFVMRGLAEAPGNAGAAGMVGLNRTVYRSVFMVLFIGFLPGAAVLVLLSVLLIEGPALILVLAGALVFYLGVFAVTGFGNVPMNKRLGRMSSRADQTAVYWPHYVRRWTRLNHVRTLAATLTAMAWLIAANTL